MVKAIIFDWNGVIIDDMGAIARMDCAVISALGGKKVSVATWYKEITQDWSVFFRRYGVQKKDLKKAMLLKAEYYPKYLRYVHLGNNVRFVLESLRKKGIRLGVLSGNSRNNILLNMNMFSLDNYFSFIVSGDDVAHQKPHPEPLEKALRAARVSSDEVLYVDDMPTILDVAHRFGLTTVGMQSKISGDLSSADYVIYNIRELLGIVDACNQQRTIQHKLSIGTITSMTRYAKGQHNQTFKVVTDKSVFTLRLYKYKKLPDIKFEIALLNLLRGLPVPKLVKRNKRYYTQIDGKYAILYTFIPGTHLQTYTTKQLKEVGGFLAKFHTRGEKFIWRKPRYKFYNLPDSKIKRFAALAKRAHVPFLKILPSIICELRENRLHPELPQGPIHVDVKPENVLFDNGKLSGVLDFDNSYIGPYLLDLAKAMVWFGTRKKKFHLRDAAMVYKGYVRKRKLSTLEHNEFYKAVKFAFLSHVFVDYYMYAIRATTKEYFDFIVNELYKAYRSFTLTKEEFSAIFDRYL